MHDFGHAHGGTRPTNDIGKLISFYTHPSSHFSFCSEGSKDITAETLTRFSNEWYLPPFVWGVPAAQLEAQLRLLRLLSILLRTTSWIGVSFAHLFRITD
ncbi:hypothetical protein CEXT_394981 [Caerostris extrusa]|uniref:Uncharacterized protein n=1 Tax=Caerostris extrusa TaxID=172846 RepID=A0AAV4XRR6_CAEEX|nr:hypothetical protein CEXT_394981 [Caerostris extrusa]